MEEWEEDGEIGGGEAVGKVVGGLDLDICPASSS